jgi:hypothetical protein
MNEDAQEVAIGSKREFDHVKLGVRLILRHSADDLTQDEVEKFMGAYQKQPQGTSLPEDNGKTLRSALEAGWIEAFSTPKGEITQAAQVGTLKPAVVRWAATQIDLVYNEARKIPNA